ncbi:MAG: DUF4426 domain-containing protein [Pseudomonadales bacterium]|jgi:hypothetical protein
MKRIFIWLLFPVLVQAASETISDETGEYTVYYQAVNSTFITPDIAEQYGIVRSDRRAFLNISVIKNEVDGTAPAVPANISGGKRNLLGQTGNIKFLEIREATAIYYIGEFDFSNAERVRFSVDVQPENSGTSHEVRWESRMYNN